MRVLVNTLVFAVFAALSITARTAAAEVSEVKIARQYGIGYLPIMIMERDRLLEWAHLEAPPGARATAREAASLALIACNTSKRSTCAVARMSVPDCFR